MTIKFALRRSELADSGIHVFEYWNIWNYPFNLSAALYKRAADLAPKDPEAYAGLGGGGARLTAAGDWFDDSRHRARVGFHLRRHAGELAGWSGCSREAASKALATLRGLGWIDTRRRQIVVRDVAALRRFAP